MPGRSDIRALKRRGLSVARQADDELSALAWAGASCLNTSLVKLDEAFYEGQSEPQAAAASVQGAIGLAKDVKQVRQEVRVDSHAGIANRKSDLLVLPAH